MKRLLSLLCLTALLTLPTPQARALGPIPAVVLSTHQTAFFYILGLLDGQTQIGAMTQPPHFGFRHVASTQRAIANMLADTPIGFSYMLGFAQAFDDRANAAGEAPAP